MLGGVNWGRGVCWERRVCWGRSKLGEESVLAATTLAHTYHCHGHA